MPTHFFSFCYILFFPMVPLYHYHSGYIPSLAPSDQSDHPIVLLWINDFQWISYSQFIYHLSLKDILWAKAYEHWTCMKGLSLLDWFSCSRNYFNSQQCIVLPNWVLFCHKTVIFTTILRIFPLKKSNLMIWYLILYAETIVRVW